MANASPPAPLYFFTRSEVAILTAFVDQIIPDEEEAPGASRSGVISYIDQLLAGFGRDLQGVYRAGLAALQAVVSDAPEITFADLTLDRQAELVAHMDGVSRSRPEEFIGQFFAIVREHTIQGFFGDPAYGGNQNVAGWRLVGFPGAQWGYEPEQMARDFDARRIPILTLADLYSRIGAAD